MSRVITIDDRISRNGWMGVLLALALILSISGDWRIPVAGSLMHPYLVLFPFLVFLGGVQLFHVSKSILISVVLFFLFFSFPMLLERSYSEVLKVGAGVVTFLFFVQCVKSEPDIEACTLGFIIVSVWLSLKVIYLSQIGQGGGLLEGINALTGLGNKNAQSQFTLPGFTFIAFNLVHHWKKRNVLRAWIYILLSLPVIIGSVLTGNRSGYIGIVIVVLVTVIAFRFSFRAMVLLFVLIFSSSYLIDRYALKTFERKIEVTTRKDYVSDQIREDLLLESIKLGFENPFPGLGFNGLAQRLAERLKLPYRKEIDPHNLFGYLMGAGGVFSIFLFLWFFRTMVIQTLSYWKVKRKIEKFKKAIFYDRRITIWILGFIILFLVRSLFTRELIYSPHFMGGLGLIYSIFIHYSLRIRYAISS